MEKFKDQKREEVESVKACEGLIGKLENGWNKKLPNGVKEKDVTLFMDERGDWHWCLPDSIADDKKKKFDEEQNNW